MKSILTNFKSGIVVFLVALPLCLGIALACSVPLLSGILAGVIGGIVVASFSGSVLSISGPAAGLTSIILASVSSLGTFEIFIAAVMFAGILQIGLGLMKAGGIGNFVPSAVIKGMLAGIGIILIMKQVPHLAGYDRDPEGNFDFFQQDGHNTFSDLYYMFNYISFGAIFIGAVSILILVIGERTFYKKNKFLSFVPPPLAAVIVGVLLNVSFNNNDLLRISEEHMVALPLIRNFSDFTSTLIFPDFSAIQTIHFWGIVITIAVVASLESLLSVEAADKLDPEKRDSNSNKELVAQGIGNIFCGLLGALPVTAVIVRSSANIHAGATSKLSSIIHGILLLLSILFIPLFLMMIPNASLAAILIFIGYKLTKLQLFKYHFKRGIDQFLPFLVTIVVMLITDLLKGVGAGIAVSIFFIIRYNVNSSFEVMEALIEGRRSYLIKLPQHITFFNKGFIIEYLNKIKKESLVIIDGSINKSTDKDIREVLLDFVEISKQKKIEIQLVKYNIE